MSMDAGGLAQMTYQSSFNSNNTSLGVSGPGFASRGKGAHIKRLSVPPPSKISTIDETQQANNVSTPRTARGHLLAGLRTAPKSATAAPASNGLENSRYADAQFAGSSRVPQTSAAAYFPQGRKMSNEGNSQTTTNNSNYQPYGQQHHVLAPPLIDLAGQGLDGIDPEEYEALIATNKYLAQQQRQLQQQLAEITSAAQQFGHLNLNTNLMAQQQLQTQTSSPMTFYNQQFQQGLQPIVQPVPGNPGMFSVYNPMTGQSNFVYDNSAQQQNLASPAGDGYRATSPQTAPQYQRQSSDPIVPRTQMRSVSPPKPTPSPQNDVEPLPPPSANAFRRGHRKNMSSANIKTTGEWARTAGPRSAGVPATPMTGTFGPGHGRVGEHPLRQPKGPPLLQELEEKPTSKHEGSKNFAARQRRRAVFDLVKAGRERRSDGRQPGSGAGTPGSENEFNFSVSGSDSDSVLAGSTSLTSRPSIGSLRACASGAIGSERKEKSRDRSSVGSNSSTKSSGLDQAAYGEMEASRRSTPLLVLSSAEKRKSVVM